MLELADAWGKRYGQRPSDLLHGDAFDNAFDVLCLRAGRERQAREARAHSKSMLGTVVAFTED